MEKSKGLERLKKQKYKPKKGKLYDNIKQLY